MSEHEDYPHYSIVLQWDEVDRIYVVSIPEFDGVHTHGETLEEAVRHAREVIELCVDDARAHGEELPPPRHYVLEREPIASTA